jgi:hypothetical protein
MKIMKKISSMLSERKYLKAQHERNKSILNGQGIEFF